MQKMLPARGLLGTCTATNKIAVLTSAVQNRFCHKKTTPVKLPNLPYAYEALEPAISRDIMQLHHQKHHQAYVNGLNDALQKLDAAKEKGCVKTIIALEPALRFHGGGHLNHSIFWQNMCPGGSKRPAALQQALERDFKSFDAFKKRLSEAAVGVQGSGWAWLGYSKANERLEVRTCGNQDPLEATTGLIPLLGIDVWEHAYYLQYKNVRAEYVQKIWDVINWEDVNERYLKASK